MPVELGEFARYAALETDDAQGLAWLHSTTWVWSARQRIMIVEIDPSSGRCRELKHITLGDIRVSARRPDLEHIGAVSAAESAIYAPVDEGKGPAVLVTMDDNLEIVGINDLPPQRGPNGRDTDWSAPWCALDPHLPHHVFVGSKYRSNRLHAYTAIPELARAPSRDFILSDRNRKGDRFLAHIQGVAFSGPSYVAISTAEARRNLGFLWKYWVNHVRLYDANGTLESRRRYNFPHGNDEIEGLAIGPGGIHAAVCDNDAASDEFYQYRIGTFTQGGSHGGGHQDPDDPPIHPR